MPVIQTSKLVPLVDFPDQYGQTLLLLAVKNNNLSLVRRLLATRADVNIADLHGWTPLHYALKTDREPVRNMRVDAGADPNFDDEYGEDIAACNEDPIAAYQTRSIIYDLITAGADLEARNSHDETPLLVAAKYKRAFGNMAFLIFHRAWVDAIDDHGNGIAFHPFKQDIRILRRLARLSLTDTHRADIDACFVTQPRDVFVRYVKELVGSYASWSSR